MIKKFEFQGFQDSYAWNVFFDALQKAMQETGQTFSDLFCQEKYVVDGQPVMSEGRPKFTIRKDGTGFFKTEQQGNYFVVFIDTMKEVGFKGVQVSADGVLWRHSETPKEGQLLVNMGDVEETYVDKEVGESLDLEKASLAIDDVVSLMGVYPSLPFKRKKSSPVLLADALSRAGISYELQYGATEAPSVTIQNGIEILSLGEIQMYKSNAPLNVGDYVLTDQGKVEIIGISTLEVLLSEQLQPGVYSVEVNSTVTPWIQSAPNYVNLVLVAGLVRDRMVKQLAESIFYREKPFRLNGSVIYLDRQLQAPINIGTTLVIDRNPVLEITDNQGNKISSVRIGWEEGATAVVFIRSKNVDYWTSKNENTELGITPESSEDSLVELRITVLEANREYREKSFILQFNSDEYNGQPIEPLQTQLQVIQEQWNPLIVTDLNVIDGIDFTDSISVNNGSVILEQVTFSESYETVDGSKIVDTIAFTDEPSEQNEGFTPEDVFIDSNGGEAEIEFNFDSDWVMTVEDI